MRTASAPTQTQPKPARTIAIGAFIGFVFGIMLAFLQDVLDTRVRSADEIGRRLRLPLLAQIPTPPRQAGGELVMLLDPVPALVPSTEAYRIAKLNFTGALNATGARIIMFTSAAEKDGTSPTVANLALVLARAGKHVVLVDANLRDPVQADHFGLHAPVGLADVLSGTAKLADVLTGVDVRRVGVDAGTNGRAPVDGILEVVPAGRAPYDAAELLDTRAAGELLRALAGRADVVLVDAPAILPVSDAMVLATKVDGVVVVTRAGRDSRSAVVALAARTRQLPGSRSGVHLHRSIARRSQRVRRLLSSRLAGHRSRHPGRTRSGIRATRARSACCESRAGVLVRRAPDAAPPASAVVGEARALLGDVPTPRF